MEFREAKSRLIIASLPYLFPCHSHPQSQRLVSFRQARKNTSLCMGIYLFFSPFEKRDFIKSFLKMGILKFFFTDRHTEILSEIVTYTVMLFDRLSYIYLNHFYQRIYVLYSGYSYHCPPRVVPRSRTYMD